MSSPPTSLQVDQLVDWWSVHLHVEPVLQEVGCWPMAGTAAWQILDESDPAKLAALLDSARRHVLRVDIAQDAIIDASRTISLVHDWREFARKFQRRRDVYIPRIPRERWEFPL